MDGSDFFLGSAIPSLPELDIQLPSELEALGPLDLLPTASENPEPWKLRLVREKLTPERAEEVTDAEIAKIMIRHEAPGDVATILSTMNFSFGPEIWSNDLSSKVALVGGRSKEGALCVLIRAGSYELGASSKPAVLFAGETILADLDEQIVAQTSEEEGKLDGKILAIVDFRGFYPTPAHLPFAVWLFSSVISAYSDRVERLLAFGTGYFLSGLWLALKAVTPASTTSLVEFVDENTIWNFVEKDGFVLRPLHHVIKERATKVEKKVEKGRMEELAPQSDETVEARVSADDID
jgi:hypothetical protein